MLKLYGTASDYDVVSRLAQPIQAKLMSNRSGSIELCSKVYRPSGSCCKAGVVCPRISTSSEVRTGAELWQVQSVSAVNGLLEHLSFLATLR